jgi:superkiller protein 3
LSGDLHGAVASYRTAVELEPLDAKNHNDLAYYLRLSGDLQGAIASFRTAVGLEPLNSAFHYHLAYYLRLSGDLHGAIEACHASLAILPDFPYALFNLGISLFEIGDAPASLECLRKCRISDMNEYQADAHLYLGKALHATGDTLAAIESFNAALASNAQHEEARECLASAMAELGDPSTI